MDELILENLPGLVAYGAMDALILSAGTSSAEERAVANVPPDIPPFSLMPVIDCSINASGPASALIVLQERNADTSEGKESNPHAGMMIAPVFVA